MKKSLPLIVLFSLIALSCLHRGGISFQAHLLWTISLLPLLVSIYIQKNRHHRNFPTPLLGLMLLFGLSIMFGWLTTTMRDFGFISITSLLSGIATLFIIIQLDISEEYIHKFFTSLALFAAGLCIFGTTLYITTPADRLASTFAQLPYIVTSYPNAFALFLIALLPYTLLRFAKAFSTQHDISEKITWFIVTGLILTSLLLTFSRGGMIVAALIIGLLIIRKKLFFKKPLILLAIVVVVCVGAIQLARSQQFATNQFAKKITLQSDEKTSSVDERVDFWKGSLQMIADRPLTGFGPDTFEYVFPHYQKQPLANSSHPHNMFLKHAVEFGVPSTLLLIALIVWILVIGYRWRKKSELMIVFVLSAGGIVAHNIIDYNLNFTSNAILFWTFLGLILNIALRTKEGIATDKPYPETLITPRRIVHALSIIIVSILFLGGSYEIYQRQKIVHARTLTAQMEYEKAEAVFAETHPIFFEDAVLLRANNALDMKNYDLAHTLLQEITNRNPIYAEAYSIWSQILTKTKHYPEAEQVGIRALQLDRWNRLKYFATLIAIEKKLGKNPDEKLIKSYIKMLETYLELLKNNSHNTISTDNPSSAIQMIDELSEPASPIEKLKLKKLRAAILETTQIEQEKFFSMFHIPVNPL